ncbi:MAG: heavy metal translocating P-type ATPase [Nitrospinota bacterium]
MSIVKVEIGIDGMRCASCVSAIERELSKNDAIAEATVNLVSKSAAVSFDDNLVQIEDLHRTIDRIGYQSYDIADSFNPSERSREEIVAAATFNQFVVAIILASILMFVSMSNILGSTYGAILEFLLSSVVIFYLGRRFIKAAYKGALNSSLDMNSLIAVGVLSAYSYSTYLLLAKFLSFTDIRFESRFFDSASIIIALMLLGRYLEERGMKKVSEAIAQLSMLQPDKATIIKDGNEQVISIDQVSENDIVALYPGSAIPTDGEVVEGSSYAIEAMLTGESRPIAKSVGDKVIGGTVNQSGFLKYRAYNLRANSMLAKIINLVREAQSYKAPIQRLADKVSGYFVLAIFIIAASSFVYWQFFAGIGDLTLSVTFFISTLIIACPCALGLATPTAIMVGVGQSAKHGVLIRNGAVVEQLSNIDTICIDKTGTITSGAFKLVKTIPIEASESEESILALAGSVEQFSEHPIGRAIVDRCKDLQLRIEQVENFQSQAGRSVSAELEGKKIVVSSLDYAQSQNFIDPESLQLADSLLTEGVTTVVVSLDGKSIGLIGIADQIKDSSYSAISELQKLLEVIILTGDKEKVANSIGTKLNVAKTYAELLPEDKAKFILDLQDNEGRKVAMVGDGVNDAPALAVSDVGFAISTGTDVAAQTADIVLAKSDLNDILVAIRISKATLRKIKQNLFLAFGYNILLVPIAAGILYQSNNIVIEPIFAAIAMSLSSVSVISNSLLLRWQHNR